MAWLLSPTNLAAIALLTVICYKIWAVRNAEREVQRLEKEFGCAPPPLWAARWPMGIDLLLKALWSQFRHGKVMEFFLKVSNLSGPTHIQSFLGMRNIGTTSPKNLEAILKEQAKEFNLGFRIPQFRDLMGDGVFTQDGVEWQHSRDLLRPIFKSTRYQGFEDIRQSVESMLDKIDPTTVVDMQPLFFSLTFETTLFMLFGASAYRMISRQEGEQGAEFQNSFNTAQEYLSYRTRVGDLWWLFNGPGMWRACSTVHRFLDSAIKEALEAKYERDSEPDNARKYVFIDALIEQTKDPKVLRDQCLSLLLAGRDSTAACLVWTLRLLARHEGVLEKVRDEVVSAVGLGHDAPQPSREDLSNMPYLELVIKESLRLYPPVPVNQRAASKTTTLPEGGGPDGKSKVLVEKGASVGYLTYALHRREDLYGKDALEFKPERWQDEALKNIGCGYLPFGVGRRSCLGREFAMLEATYTVARMVQRFPFVRVAEGQTLKIGEERQLLTLALSSGEGCFLRLS